MSFVISLNMAYPFRDGYYRRCFGFDHPKDTPPFSFWQSTTFDYNSLRITYTVGALKEKTKNAPKKITTL